MTTSTAPAPGGTDMDQVVDDLATSMIDLLHRYGGIKARVSGPTADANHPGGSGTANAAPPGFFNVAFRYDEPMPKVGDPAGTAESPAWWRDNAQGEALAAGDMRALETVVPKKGVNTLIPSLKAAGARDVLELPISKIVE